MDLRTTPLARWAMAYVRNTQGGATVAHFIDDFAPVGALLWATLVEVGYVTTNAEACVVLTPAGTEALRRVAAP